MQKTLLSLAAFAAATASLAAQCVAPTGTQTLETIFAGTTYYSSGVGPNYAVSLDPGTAVRFDLSVNANINLTQIATNFLNDGLTYGTTPCPNLVGAPNGTMEVWVAAGTSTNNPALYAGNVYTHIPSVPPVAPWTLLSNQVTHLNNLVFAAPDTPSIATFNPPLTLAPGNYAVELVFVPKGVATLPAGTGTPANTATDRIHPLFTDMSIVPVASSFSDEFIQITNPGVTSPAFANGTLNPSSTPSGYMPNFSLSYTLGANISYSSKYGTGCYDRKRSFYESWANGGTMDIDAQAGINGLDMFFIGDNYIVTNNTTPGLIVTPGSSPGAAQINTQTPLITTGAWDDALANPITMPFAFPFPGNQAGLSTLHISSNGVVYFGSATNTFGFYNNFSTFLANRPAIAGAWCDFEPADLATFQGGTGNIWYDTDNLTYAAITWAGCQIWNQPTNLSTVQIVLSAGGGVNIRYGAGGVNSAVPVLVGFTPGNGAPDPGTGAAVSPRQAPDLSVAASGGGYVSGDGAAPAVLSLVNRPKPGNALAFTTTNIDPTGVINITLISTASLPGISLAGLGMQGCNAYINLPEIASNFGIVSGGTDTWNALASIPPSFAGVNLYAQAAQLATGFPVSYNSANILVSSGLCIHFDQF